MRSNKLYIMRLLSRLHCWIFVFVGYVSNSANMMGTLNPAEPAVGVTKRR